MTGSPPRGSRSPYVVPLSNSARPSRAAVSRITRLSGRMNSAPISTIAAGGQLLRPDPAADPVTGLEHEDVDAGRGERIGRGKAREPRAHDDHPHRALLHRPPARGSHRSPAGARRARADHRPVRGRSARSRLDSGRAARHVARDPWRLRVGARPRLGPVAEGLARPARAPDPERARRRVDRRRRDRGRDDRGRERAARAQPAATATRRPSRRSASLFTTVPFDQDLVESCAGCPASRRRRAGGARPSGS